MAIIYGPFALQFNQKPTSIQGRCLWLKFEISAPELPTLPTFHIRSDCGVFCVFYIMVKAERWDYRAGGKLKGHYPNVGRYPPTFCEGRFCKVIPVQLQGALYPLASLLFFTLPGTMFHIFLRTPSLRNKKHNKTLIQKAEVANRPNSAPNCPRPP